MIELTVLILVAVTCDTANSQSPVVRTPINVRTPVNVRSPVNGQGNGFRVPPLSPDFRVPPNVQQTNSQPPTGIRFNTDTSQVNLNPGVQQNRPGGQQSRSGAQQNLGCAATGRDTVAQCFLSNGGFQMQYVISLLSNGSQGQMPPNPSQMKRALCNAQGNIIACVFSGVNSLRNTPTCPTTTAFVRLEQETVTLITELQQACGSGPMPPPSPCLKDLNSDLRKCYNKVGLNPELFAPSENRLAMDIIGNNREKARKFCIVKDRLFDCMKKTMDRCQGSTEVMAMGGYEHESLRKGIDVLCKDVHVYVKGVDCFQKPTEQTKKCSNLMVQKVTNLKAQRIQTNMPAEQYHTRYCQIRVQHLECDIAAWMKKCDLDEVGLKNELECNLLPSRCKNDRTFQPRLRQTCSVASFQRQLRNGASSTRTISGIVMSAFTVLLVMIL